MGVEMSEDTWGGEGHRITFSYEHVSMEMLRAGGVTDANAVLFIAPLNMACHEFELETPLRIAHFLAQVCHESNGFAWLEEKWGPTQWQIGYENRHDLGNDRPEAGGPGNGRRWCGHGPIQITGFNNHVAMANYFSIPVSQIAAWLMTPIGGARSAARYFTHYGCVPFADADDIVGVTRKINPGLLGIADRGARLAAIRKVLGI